MSRETLSGKTRKERKKDSLQLKLNAEYRALVNTIASPHTPQKYNYVYDSTEPVEVNGVKVYVVPEIISIGGNVHFDQSKVRIKDASDDAKRTVVDLKEGEVSNVEMRDVDDKPVVRRRKSHPKGSVSDVPFKIAAKETIILLRGIRNELTRQPKPEPVGARN